MNDDTELYGLVRFLLFPCAICGEWSWSRTLLVSLAPSHHDLRSFVYQISWITWQGRTRPRQDTLMRGVDDNDDADRFRLSVHVEPRALADLFSTFRRT